MLRRKFIKLLGLATSAGLIGAGAVRAGSALSGSPAVRPKTLEYQKRHPLTKAQVDEYVEWVDLRERDRLFHGSARGGKTDALLCSFPTPDIRYAQSFQDAANEHNKQLLDAMFGSRS